MIINRRNLSIYAQIGLQDKDRTIKRLVIIYCIKYFYLPVFKISVTLLLKNRVWVVCGQMLK